MFNSNYFSTIVIAIFLTKVTPIFFNISKHIKPMAAHEANPGDFIPAKSIKFLQVFASLIIKSFSVLLALKPEKLLIFSQYGTLDIVFETLSFTSLRPSMLLTYHQL